jgi:hypothetical protein
VVSICGVFRALRARRSRGSVLPGVWNFVQVFARLDTPIRRPYRKARGRRVLQ